MNYNHFIPTDFKFKIIGTGLESVNANVTQVTIPTISFPEILVQHKNVNTYQTGDKIDYEPLQVQMLLDEDLDNWRTIFDWMKANHLETAASRVGKTISVIVPTGHKNPNVEFIFENAFPTSIGGFDVSSTLGSVDAVYSSVSFRYDTMKVNKLS